MHCDICDKFLVEEDTHENILCTRCMTSRETIHCSKCKCKLTFHKFYLKTIEMLKNQKLLSIFSVILCISLVILYLINARLALYVATGVFAFPIVLGSVVLLYFVSISI